MRPRREISTSIGTHECAVCGRTLLRGEHPAYYLAEGQTREVCELCRARAEREGWRREDAAEPIALPEPVAERPRLRERLRGRRPLATPEAPGARRASPPREPRTPELAWEREREAVAVGGGVLAPAAEPEPVETPATEGWAPEPACEPTVHAIPSAPEARLARALECFNASEHSRMVASVARALDVPLVHARLLEPEGTAVTIVLAWELCWYRYEIDLADERPAPRRIAQGDELSELGPEDLEAVGHADPDGVLLLGPAE